MNRLAVGFITWTCMLVVACGSNAGQQQTGGSSTTPAEQTSPQLGTTSEPQAAVPPQSESASAVARTAGTAVEGDKTGSAAAPARAQFREVTVPAGTPLRLTLESAISSDTSKPEDPVRAELSGAIVVDGTTVVPAGAEVTGFVVDAKESGRVKGRGQLSWRFTQLRSEGKMHDIRTALISRTAEATKSEDAKKIGVGAGAGAVIGAIAGGKKGAAIGTAVGGGAGTGVVLATKGEEVQLGAGAAMRTTLTEPLAILVRVR